ncbi:MAG: hypothetical protein ACO3M5_03805 [Saprospiraceae bacterium]|jgi:hypothetical protein
MNDIRISREGQKAGIKQLISKFRAEMTPIEKARRFNRMERRRALMNLVRKLSRHQYK